LKGLYWLILGLSVWFIPTIIFQIITTSEDSLKTAEEAVSDIPKEVVIVLFAISLPIIVKGVITTRKERKALKNNEDRKNKKSKKEYSQLRG
jgi:ABC-type spermidine/putrescine transport system permease subunit II